MKSEEEDSEPDVFELQKQSLGRTALHLPSLQPFPLGPPGIPVSICWGHFLSVGNLKAYAYPRARSVKPGNRMGNIFHVFQLAARQYTRRLP